MSIVSSPPALVRPNPRPARAPKVVVPEDEEWKAQLKGYEREKKEPAFEVSKIERVTHASRMRQQATFNPITGRYTDAVTEIQARSNEEAQREKTEKSRSYTKYATSYNILNNQDKGVDVPLAEVAMLRKPAPAPVDDEPKRERLTTNHTRYSYNIVSNSALPKDAESLAPDIRNGKAASRDRIEGARTAKKVITIESGKHSFNIINNEATASPSKRRPSPLFGASASTEAQGSAGSSTAAAADHDGEMTFQGKRIFPRKETYNVITGAAADSPKKRMMNVRYGV